LRAGCVGNRVRSFCSGEQYDSDLALYYLRARYYNPATGRFLSRDPDNPSLFDSNGLPTDPKYLHKYLYANGNPVNAKDPTGRGAFEDGIIWGWAVVSVVKDVVWMTCAIVAAYAAAAEAIEWKFGETGKKAVPPFPPGPGLLCFLYAL
jgi:RHS repeat-associated protein